MIITPIDNFVFRAFATKTINLDVALRDLDESLHVLYVDFVGDENYLLVIENRSVCNILKLGEIVEFLGSRSLELVNFRLQREQSKLTLGKISNPLLFFYDLLIGSQLVLNNLDTNYFSFWRFVSTIKDDNSYGLCSLSNSNATLWAIFEAGELSGGWLCKNVTDEPTSLCVDRVLEEAVRIAGKASFYRNTNHVVLDIDKNTIFEKKRFFQNLLKPDDMARFTMKRKFGEFGFIVAAQFDGRKTVDEIATEMRIPFEKTREIARQLYELGILSRC